MENHLPDLLRYIVMVYANRFEAYSMPPGCRFHENDNFFIDSRNFIAEHSQRFSYFAK